MGVFLYSEAPKLESPLPKTKVLQEDRTKANNTGFSNNTSRSMSSPSFIEFGPPPFPKFDTIFQSGPLKYYFTCTASLEIGVANPVPNKVSIYLYT